MMRTSTIAATRLMSAIHFPLATSSCRLIHSSPFLANPPAPSNGNAPALPRQLASINEAVEIIDAKPNSPTKLMFTCEHASMRLPAPWKWPAEDSRLLGDHWSYDPGAEDFTRELNARISSVGILGRFSRLLCDPNREVGSDTMFRNIADNKPVFLNAKENMSPEEIQKRLDVLYYPYHKALKKVFNTVHPTIILCPHSFTPVYEGQKRTIEIGVLYNPEKDRPLAEKFVNAYRAAGIVTDYNAPWSGQKGFMFAIDKFSNPNTRSIMFEFRQDLIVQKEWRDKVVKITEQVLREEGHA